MGYDIRELSSSETDLYCSSNLTKGIPTFPKIQKQINFTSDFLIRTYTSGCYYYNTLTGKWSSDGMEIYEDTNLEQIHCLSYHLTSFAGGLEYSPSIINYQYAFANAAVRLNLTIYITVLVFIILYIISGIFARYWDKRDMKKMNIIALVDNDPAKNYFYELMVFTGNRSESETNSKVKFLLLKNKC